MLRSAVVRLTLTQYVAPHSLQLRSRQALPAKSNHIDDASENLARFARWTDECVRPYTIYPTTSIPMDLAVPRMLLIAVSIEAAFRSGIFCLAMSSTCLAVTLPTLSLFGVPEPLAMPAARFNRIAAGGVLVMKVNERSLYTDTTTGMIRPSSSFWLVLALNCLQNSMMLICAWPNAGPTGGAGVALPAAICSFT